MTCPECGNALIFALNHWVCAIDGQTVWPDELS